MFKWLVAAIFVVLKSGIIAETIQLQNWQEEALSYIAEGNASLFSGKAWQALEYLQKAKSSIDDTDPSASPIGFFVNFSQIIAYDRLGFHDLCKQSIGALFLTINENEEENFEIEEEKDNESDPMLLVNFLQNLTMFAVSEEVKELLFSVVDDIAEVLLPSFKFADQSFLDDLQYGYQLHNNSSIDLCKRKSFWAKLKKWCAEVEEWFKTIKNLLTAANDTREAYKKWKNANQFDVSYEEFKQYYNQNRINSILQGN